MHPRLPLLLLTGLVALAGCDYLGIEAASAAQARRAAEGKAIGAACRHAGRAIEDCFALNARADKASVYAGWREMNDYMTENRIEVVPPQRDGADLATHGDDPATDAGPPARRRGG